MKDDFNEPLAKQIASIKEQHEKDLQQKSTEYEQRIIQAKFDLYNTKEGLKKTPDNTALITTQETQKTNLNDIKSNYRKEIDELNSANEKTINLTIEKAEWEAITKKGVEFNAQINPLIEEAKQINERIKDLQNELKKEEGDILTQVSSKVSKTFSSFFASDSKQNIDQEKLKAEKASAEKISTLKAQIEAENTILANIKSQQSQLIQDKDNAIKALHEQTAAFKNKLQREQEDALANADKLKAQKAQKIQAIPKPVPDNNINRIIATTYLLSNNILDIIASSSNKIEGISSTDVITQILTSNWRDIEFVKSATDARDLYNSLSELSKGFTNISALASSPAAQSILADPGIFSALSINAEAGAIGKFIDAFQDEIGNAVAKALPKADKPKTNIQDKTKEAETDVAPKVKKLTLNLKDQLDMVEKLLANPEFLKFIDTVTKTSQANIEALIIQNPKLNLTLKEAFGMEAQDIAALVPILSLALSSIASQQPQLSEAFQIMKPMISSEVVPAKDAKGKEKTKTKITLNKEGIDVLKPIVAQVITDKELANSIKAVVSPQNLKLMGDTFAKSTLPYAEVASHILEQNPNILDPLANTVNSLLDELSKNKESTDKLVDDIKNIIQVNAEGKISVKPDIIALNNIAVEGAKILVEPAKKLASLATKENTTLLLSTFSEQIQNVVKDNVADLNVSYKTKNAISELAVNAHVHNLAGQIIEKTASNLPNILKAYDNNAEKIGNILEKSVLANPITDEKGKEKIKIKFIPNKKVIDDVIDITSQVVTDENFAASAKAIVSPQNLKLIGETFATSNLPYADVAASVVGKNPKILEPLAHTANSLLEELSNHKEFTDTLVKTAKNSVQMSAEGKISVKPNIAELHDVAVKTVAVFPKTMESLPTLLSKDNTALLLSTFKGPIQANVKKNIADISILSDETKNVISTLAGHELIHDFAGQVVEKTAKSVPAIMKSYEKAAPVITKVLKGEEDFKNSKFKPENDLNAEELHTLLVEGINIAKEIDLVDLMTKNEEKFKTAVSSVTDNPLYVDAVPLLTKMAPLFASKEKLESLEKDVIPSLASMLDNTVTDKKLQKKDIDFQKNLSLATDFFVNIVLSKEFSEILSPYINKHKEALSKLIKDELIDKNPSLQGIRIEPGQIMQVITDASLLHTLKKVYENIKHGNYLRAAGYGIKAMYQSKDANSIVSTALADGAKIIFKEKLIPNFLRNALIGNTINNAINEACSQEVATGTLKDIGEAFNKQGKAISGMLGNAFKTRNCTGLDIKLAEKTSFNQSLIEDFNFKNATFVGNEASSFKGATIKNTKFSNVTFKGNVIDLSDATIDLKSLKTLIPALKKAHDAGVEIKTDNMSINVKTGKNTSLEDIAKLVREEFKDPKKPEEAIEKFIEDKLNVKDMAKKFVDKNNDKSKSTEHVDKFNNIKEVGAEISIGG